MSMNQTPASERTHISFFGKRNAGKSSIINAVTSQSLSIVSDQKGTTTDPVYKTMELLPLGPVMLIDTPGIDDEGELGELRVKRSYQVLNKTDIAVLIVDAAAGKSPEDEALIRRFCQKGISYLVVYNKSDLLSEVPQAKEREIWVSAHTGLNIHQLKEKIASLKPEDSHNCPLIQDLLDPLDLVVLVVPIDKAAPKGRLILPQQQTIRDILEAGACPVVTRDTELKDLFSRLSVKPRMVITDSQVFSQVDKDTPEDVPLTSFSILMARYKGDLESSIIGAAALDYLQDGDSVLIAEGCTHHRQCDDIGTVKIPRWIRNYTGKDLNFSFVSGTEFPEDLSPYRLVIHCGGCMLNPREMKYRIQCSLDQNVPITNYGIVIAYVSGILKRSLEPFPGIAELLSGR